MIISHYPCNINEKEHCLKRRKHRLEIYTFKIVSSYYNPIQLYINREWQIISQSCWQDCSFYFILKENVKWIQWSKIYTILYLVCFFTKTECFYIPSFVVLNLRSPILHNHHHLGNAIKYVMGPYIREPL